MTTALITGATSGIGAAFADHLAATGHDLVLVARTRGALEDKATELRERCGVRVEVLVADLSDRGDLSTVEGRLADGAAPVDLLVNNAGFGSPRTFLGSEIAEEERAVAVMVQAVLVLSHAAGRAMRERGHGAIVNVSSVASFITTGTYSAAKAWVTTFSEGLRDELSPHGVVVTALCPGFTHTDFHRRAEMTPPSSEFMWLDADDVVRACLDDVRRGRAISVPGAQYKGVTALLGLLPRAAVRRISRALR